MHSKKCETPVSRWRNRDPQHVAVTRCPAVRSRVWGLFIFIFVHNMQRNKSYEAILWGFKHATGFIRRGTLHSLSVTSAGRPPVVGYPLLLIQRNRSCHPPPAGRLCKPQPEGTPYHSNNSRHLNQRRSLWNVAPLYPQIYVYTRTRYKVWYSVEAGLHNFLWYKAVPL